MKKSKEKNTSKKLRSVAMFFAIVIPTVGLWVALIFGVKYFMDSLMTPPSTNSYVSENQVTETNPYIEPETTLPAVVEIEPQPTVVAFDAPTTVPVREDVAVLVTQKTNSVATTNPKKAEKTTESTQNKNSSYNTEIEKENKKHQEKLKEIDDSYDLDIRLLRGDINYYRGICGYAPSSSYESSISTLKTETEQKEKKLAMMKMDTSGVYRNQILALERELESDYAELEDLVVKQTLAREAEKKEAELELVEREKNNAINDENERHEKAIKSIKSKYGK